MIGIILVIGLGSMGKRRIRLLQHMDSSTVIIGIDQNQSRIEEVTRLYGIQCYNTIEEVCEEDIQIAFIATAPLSHGLLIQQCLQKGYHIFSEINLVADYYPENIQLAKERGLTLFLSSTPIYRSEMKAIHQQVSQSKDALNYIYHVGQYLPDWHPWETIADFFVSNPRTNGCREIFAIELPWMVKTFGKVKNVRSLSRKMTALEIKYQDSYLVQLEHESGHVGIMAVDIVCREPVRKLEIYGESIYIAWEGTPDTLRYKNLNTGNMEQIGDFQYMHQEQYGAFVNECAYIEEMKAFFNVLDGEACEYSFQEDEKILGVIDEIEQS